VGWCMFDRFGWAFDLTRVAALRWMLPRTMLVLIAALVGVVVVDHLVRREFAADRRGLDALTHELSARAIMPGSALACLDGLAGDAVENSCEKALFATPEATASAVSYVAAQLSLLLAAGNERARRGDQSTLANLRRSVELDRFGIVAHVLAVRDGCTPAQCDAFALMHDASRVSLNMAGHTYDAIINRHMARWPSVDRPVAGNAPPAVAEAPTGAQVAGAKLPDNLFLPSSSSIPAVSIMNTEPSSPPETTTSGETTSPTPRRKPPQAQARAPAKNPSAVPPAPLQLAPSDQ
jgi:hypothetical protein